ncbi:MAG: AIR synthase related protein [Candidatus Levybacteria bacterium]|nr:AIR synthase related protein [Candidatus Levybacteria bacterium]
MSGKENQRTTYSSTGVDYDAMDPLKRKAQLKARETAGNLSRFGYKEIEASRGESAYVWEEEDKYGAMVVEGLGTKNIVAEEMRKITGKTYHQEIAQDDVAMIVNDIIVVGAQPIVVSAYFAAGNSAWFSDEEKMEDLTEGFKNACNKAGAVWGGGESPTLKGIVVEGTSDLAGAAVGEIKPKERLVLGDKLTAGDAIFIVESSGIHANGLTLARAIADELPEGYATKLSDGKSYGESLLTPTHIYAGLVRDLFEAGIDIHYMANITGHGWRKIMRANKDFSYVIDEIPEPQPVFKFIQEQSGNDDQEMYGNLNMGAGFAIFMLEKDVELANKIAREKYGWQSWNSGKVEEGEKQVVIKPKGLTFKGATLGVR